MNYVGRRFLVATLLASIVVAGTAGAEEATFRAPPDLAQRMKDVGKIALLLKEVEVVEILSGGVREPRPEWGTDARGKVEAAIAAEFRRLGYELDALPPPPEGDDEFRSILSLYGAVTGSVLRHAYDGPNLFPEKKTRFDYTVGAIDNVLRASGADAMLVVHASDEVSTSGRKAMQTLGIVAAAVVGVVVTPNMGQTRLMVGLLDRSGDLLWFNLRGGRGGYDLRDPESVSKLVSLSFAGFPGRPK